MKQKQYADENAEQKQQKTCKYGIRRAHEASTLHKELQAIKERWAQERWSPPGKKYQFEV